MQDHQVATKGEFWYLRHAEKVETRVPNGPKISITSHVKRKVLRILTIQR